MISVLVAFARAPLGEAELVGQDLGGLDLGGVPCIAAFRNPQCVFEDIVKADICLLADPLFDHLHPDIELKTSGLFGSRKSFKLGRLQPPLRAGLEAHDGLGPDLIAVALDSVAVDHVATRNRPDASRSGRVLQIAAGGRIDRASEDALPWQADRVLAVGWTKAVETPGQISFAGG